MVAMTDGKLDDMMEAAKVQKLEKKAVSAVQKDDEAADVDAADVEAQPGSEPEPSVQGTGGESAYDCRASVCSSTAISVDECKRMTEQVRPAPTKISPELQSAWEQCEALQAELNAMSVPLAPTSTAESPETAAASKEPLGLAAASKEPLGLPVPAGGDDKGAGEPFLDRNRSFEQPESEHTPTSSGVVASFRDAKGLWDVGPTVLPPIEELRAEKRLEKPDVSGQVDQQPC
jgi:hypothetical protein